MAPMVHRMDEELGVLWVPLEKVETMEIIPRWCGEDARPRGRINTSHPEANSWRIVVASPGARYDSNAAVSRERFIILLF